MQRALVLAASCVVVSLTYMSRTPSFSECFLPVSDKVFGDEGGPLSHCRRLDLPPAASRHPASLLAESRAAGSIWWRVCGVGGCVGVESGAGMDRLPGENTQGSAGRSQC